MAAIDSKGAGNADERMELGGGETVDRGDGSWRGSMPAPAAPLVKPDGPIPLGWPIKRATYLVLQT